MLSRTSNKSYYQIFFEKVILQTHQTKLVYEMYIQISICHINRSLTLITYYIRDDYQDGIVGDRH